MPKPELPTGIIKLLLDHDGQMLSYHEKQEQRITARDEMIKTLDDWATKHNATIDAFCQWHKLNGKNINPCLSCPLWQQGDNLKWRCTR